MATISKDLFFELFEIVDNGIYRKRRGRNSHLPMKKAGYIQHGYYVVEINSKPYKEHRLLWEMLVGEIPEGMQIDHINRNRADNRIENLRLTTQLDNMRNKPKQKNNKSGKMGVSQVPSGKWIARIGVEGKKINLGTYKTFAKALDARERAEEYYGFHNTHGK